MPFDRSEDRNVRFFDKTKPDTVLGGLVQNGLVTEKKFLSMLGIVLVTEAPIYVYAKATGNAVSIVDKPLQIGDYMVRCASEIQVNNEPWIQRIISYNVSGREGAFRDGIRSRDGKCVISGMVKRSKSDNWTMFEAAHVFPLEKEGLWTQCNHGRWITGIDEEKERLRIQYNYGRWITDIDDSVGISKINSLQNGLLFRADIHGAFDQYLISVNPDDSYKVVVFDVDNSGVDGRSLDPVCRNPEDPHRVSDELLRWHFRQSVLANMRGAGQPVFEHDFLPGTDMMREVRVGVGG